MDQALENIRRRVDAFGVGEPDIFLSGNTIEIQIPGASDSTVESATVDLTCLGDDEATYGCGTEEQVDAALEGLEVTNQPSEVCIVTADGDDLDCLSDRQQADAALAGYTVQPEEDADASAIAERQRHRRPKARRSPPRRTASPRPTASSRRASTPRPRPTRR